MSTIKQQILDAFGDMTMTTDILSDHPINHKFIKNFLTTKEVYHIPAEKKDVMFGWKPSILFPEYDAFYHSASDGIAPEGVYTDLQDAYGICELFAVSKRLRVTPDYLRYIKSSKDGFIVNIYDIASAMISTHLWNLTKCAAARDEFLKGEIPEVELESPLQVKYTSIAETKYIQGFLLDECRNYLPGLALNLPYAYFSGQNLKGNIFTWDLNTKKYQIGGNDIAEINNRIKYLAANGFDQPLVMRIDEGCITPIDNDTAIDLFLATYLNLPSIPAILYMSDEDVMKNQSYEELFDIIHSNYWNDPSAMDLINKICRPYFFFEIAKNSASRSYLQSGMDTYNKIQYPPVNNIHDPNIVVIDRYLDQTITAPNVLLPMTEEDFKAKANAENQQLLDAINAKVKAENEEIARKILNGEL